jgi:DNA invertase Pin-like site-specific DNA recombinase
MSEKKPTRGLRLARLRRVSTERQEKEGESLATQTKQAEEDFAALGATLAGDYGGQEHATPGFEKAEVDRLIADTAKGKFDGVWVANADRWSRDNAHSEAGLNVLRDRGIRFFVRTFEYDLFNPEHCLFLGMSAVVGKFQAMHQGKKSIENRIERARRGVPTCGKLPFGRTYDREAGRWGYDPEKKALVEDIARRYLAGEPLPALAREYGVSVSHLYAVMRGGAGGEWVQEFRSARLNLHARVVTKVPALLDDDTIKAVRARAEANRTYFHGQTKHRYLLRRVVFCAHCGYAMSGHRHSNGTRYYQHVEPLRVRQRSLRPCERTSAHVNADALEDAVLRQLFDLFGNPVAVQRAVEAATQNREAVNELRARLERIMAALGKTGEARDRVIRFISRGTISEEEAEKELAELKDREAALREELGLINVTLEHQPTAAEVNAAAEAMAAAFRPRKMNAKLLVAKMEINTDFGGMSWEQARALVQMVFSGKTTEGKRMGIHIERNRGSRRRPCWDYQIAGRLVHCTGLAPAPPYEDSDPERPEFTGGHMQHWLLQEVTTNSGWY